MLVAQNSGLKVEITEGDKKIERKDHRIKQLEKNLREVFFSRRGSFPLL